MRCSCVRSRLAALAVLPVLLSCASAPPAPESIEPFLLEGMLSVEGPDPFGRTMTLEEDSGMTWNLDPGRLEHELSLLGGHRVRVFCRELSDIGESALTVEHYELLPVDGREPLYGVLKAGPDSIIVDSDGTSVLLDGPLADALVAYDGHAVWVWGKRGHGGELTVEGYVVMGRALTAPSDR